MLVLLALVLVVAVSLVPLVWHRFSPSPPHEGIGTEALHCTLRRDGARDSTISHGKPGSSVAWAPQCSRSGEKT